MDYLPLTDTGISISRLVFGCEPLGGKDWGKYDVKDVISAVRHAWETGITTFDIADVYGLGRAEELLAEALGNDRHNAVIITKGGVAWEASPETGRARTYFDSSRQYLKQAVERSLKRLDIECLPIYLAHWPDPKTPIEDVMSTLQECQREGKIRCFGVSNYDEVQLKSAGDNGAKVIEIEYSLIHQQPETRLLPLAEASRTGVICYGALAQGLLGGRYSADSQFGNDDRRHRLPQFDVKAWPRNTRLLSAMAEVAKRHNVSTGQLAIRWVLEHPAISGVIVGMKSCLQVDANLGAFGWSLTPEELHQLREAAL